MNWSRFIRRAHRWISLLFTITVGIAAWASFSGQSEDSMLYYLPLPPLFLLMASGAYLFVLPWLGRGRRGESPS